MNTRQNRLVEVYNDLRSRGIVHTKTDFAAVLHYGRTSMAAALNGSDAYLTDSLFKNVCGRFQYYNLNYLLTGEGSLLADGATSTPEPAPSTAAAAGIVELAARLVAEVEALRKELEAERRALAHEREELRFTMELLRVSIRQGDSVLPVAAEPAPEALSKKKKKNN